MCYNRYLVVTESFFLIFAVLDKKTNSVKLISFANIKSIANIKKNKESPNTLVFTFHDKSKKVHFEFLYFLTKIE
jgi:hypothetical protein